MAINGGWQRKPDSDGDWVYVSLISCGCCPYESGIAYAFYENDSDEIKIAWQGQTPKSPEILVYQKIELPDFCWYENGFTINIDYNEEFDIFPQECIITVNKDGDEYIFTGFNIFNHEQVERLKLDIEPTSYWDIVYSIKDFFDTDLPQDKWTSWAGIKKIKIASFRPNKNNFE